MKPVYPQLVFAPAAKGGTGAPQRAPRRILLVEDHPIVSVGLIALIQQKPSLEVCGAIRGKSLALEAIEKLQPDLVILEVGSKELSGLELLKDIKSFFPDLRVLMLSMHEESLYASRAIRAGAAGYVMKDEPGETLFQAIQQVLDDGVYVSRRVGKAAMQRLVQGERDSTADPLHGLSDRELEVFRMIGQGKTTREIAFSLNLSPKTVDSHRQSLKRKLSITTSVELVRRAFQREGQS